VVGNFGDEFVDPDRPYCSCGNFFFHVRHGKDELCYHILGCRMAAETGRLDVVKFDDEEFQPFFRAMFSDVYRMIDSE
jgi:predicted nucleic acid-binding Zn finger protein